MWLSALTQRWRWLSRTDQAGALYDSLGDRVVYRPTPVANMGYWAGLDPRRFSELELASDALIDRVLALLGPDDSQPASSTDGVPGRLDLLDVGCGFGRLLERSDGSRSTDSSGRAQGVGVNVSMTQLARLRAGAIGVGADAIRLPLRTGSLARLASVEAAHHVPSRLDFYREARRVLAPDGRLAVSELIVPPARGVVSRIALALHRRGMQIPAANVGSAEDLRRTVEQAGFRIASWEDASDQVVVPFKRWLIRHLPRVLPRVDWQYVILNPTFLFCRWRYVLLAARPEMGNAPGAPS